MSETLASKKRRHLRESWLSEEIREIRREIAREVIEELLDLMALSVEEESNGEDHPQRRHRDFEQGL